MRRTIATQAAILTVAAVVVVGVHKGDQETQARINAQAETAHRLAYTICEARNESIAKSNIRWGNEKKAWQAAASARRVQANATMNHATRAEYLRVAAIYESVAKSITPYQPTVCGAKP